ncbi:MAG TPA: GNAT family N-acetyltransferase [Thermomicrobiales bacterium]|nr:GNAT family N-acetyltransferase [Thermomicrobiales bacterium]
MKDHPHTGPVPQASSLVIRPLTPDRWPDLEALFGPRGATGGCWCMYWRLTRSQFDYLKGDGNRDAFREIVVEAERPPGLLAYRDDVPVGWCAVAPRDDYSGLERSRILKRVDGEPVWSITCFFVARSARRQGVTLALIEAATAFAAGHGARIVEAYPIDPRSPEVPPVFAWTGLLSAFEAVGFIEVARRSDTRPIVRFEISN